jgi:general stress protein 26
MQEDGIDLLYNSKSKHLKIKGRTTLLSQKNNCVEEYWNPYLSIYYPEGPKKLQLIKVNIVEAVIWNDHHTSGETLIEEKIQEENAIEVKEHTKLKLLLNKAS